MKFGIFVLALYIAFSAPVLTAQTVNPAEEALNQAVVDRMNYLESVYGFVFDRAELCSVSFGIPTGDTQSFKAEYIPSRGEIYLNAETVLQYARARFYFGKHAFEGPPRRGRNPDVSVLDHELGHVHADQVSRRIGNGIWPDTLRKDRWQTIMGMIMVSEGIGGFFGYNADFGRAKSAKIFPEESDYKYWICMVGEKPYYTEKGMRVLYAGGYYLVNPILRKFGERGLEYLVTHPLVLTGGKVRQAALEYQKEALAELGKNVKK